MRQKKVPKRVWIHPYHSMWFSSIKKESVLFQKDCVEFVQVGPKKVKNYRKI